MQNTYILPTVLIKQYSDILLTKSAVYLSELGIVFSTSKLWVSKQNHGSKPLYN